MASFTQKRLIVNLTLSKGSLGTSINNTKTIDGLKMDASIKKSGHPSKNTLHLKIYGMLESDMNAFTSLNFKPMRVKKNLIQVMAGDSLGMSVAFEGEISSAFSSYSGHQPVFSIEATAGYYPSIATSKAKSFKGSTSVPLLMKNLADEMGYAFENNGVTSVLSSPYLSGNAMSQASMIAESADLEFGIDDGTLFIAPRNKPRSGRAPLISPDTGLEEYPTFDKNGLKFMCLYNPNLKLGGLCVVKSKVEAANGTWRVHGVEHDLSNEDPSGKWVSKVHATQPGAPPSEENSGGAE